MNKIHVLDCTLRDGGYCNEWAFGFDNAKKITSSLVESGIEIIECGFLTNKTTYNKDVTKFTNLEQIATIIPESRYGKTFVAMINYGEFKAEGIQPYDGTSIDGIRVAFHKKDLKDALELCREIKSKGYKAFVQPMVSLSYTDEEFIELIRRVNDIEPYAFYIVDSFGMMKCKDLTRLFYMIEHNLKNDIWIGFHSHNNLQLAYSNAQNLVDIQTNRDLIIDSSVYGMGRGAGNLNTELFVDYLNDNVGKSYMIKPLLTIIDDILNDFYQQNYWGYSLPNYLSAKYHAHPNYASYLDDKKTLTVESMSEIFEMMSADKRYEFDKAYIENLYLQYMSTGQAQELHKEELKSLLKGKKVLLIAPGKSSSEEKDLISSFSSNDDVITISINSDYAYTNTDFIFLSNLRRFRELDESKRSKCIVTSNIPADNVYLQTKYQDLLNNVVTVEDNAGMMAIKLMTHYKVEEIYLAGFDGYSHVTEENYADDNAAFITRNAVLDAMNEGMTKVLSQLKETVNISFLTKPRFINI